MSERPILFSGPMVRAILAGRKTETRRPARLAYWMEGPPGREANCITCLSEDEDGKLWCYFGDGKHVDGDGVIETVAESFSPLGKPGDLLWVRETFASLIIRGGDYEHVYRASGHHFYDDSDLKWRPSIHMPKWAARIWLRVEDVRVEQAQDITEDGASTEGFERREHFMCAFDRLYPGLFDRNGWVWVCRFSVASTNGRP